MPWPNPSFEPKTHRWCSGTGAPSGEVPSQNGTFSAPKQPFLAENINVTHFKWPKKGKQLPHHTCSLTYETPRALGCPLTPQYVPETAKKWPMPHNMRGFCQCYPKPKAAYILGSVAQMKIMRAPSPPTTPPFLWFPRLRIARRGRAKELPGPRTVGANGGLSGVAKVKKLIFPKSFLNHLGCSKKCF